MTQEERQGIRFYIIGTIILSAIIVLFFACTAHAQVAPCPAVNLEKIAFIESSNNPNAWNKKEDARGLFQIRKCVLQEWNNYHRNEQYTMDDLFNEDVNRKIASWYLRKRIPQMLRHFKKDASIRNIIIAYNAGINYVVKNKPLPEITERYFKKYGV